jgi:hypothetical protein
VICVTSGKTRTKKKKKEEERKEEERKEEERKEESGHRSFPTFLVILSAAKDLMFPSSVILSGVLSKPRVERTLLSAALDLDFFEPRKGAHDWDHQRVYPSAELSS